MRILGMPLWAVVVVACAIAPFVIRLWIDAEERRAKGRTASLLASLGMSLATHAPGTPRARGSKRARAQVGAPAEAGSSLAASTEQSSSKSDVKSGAGDGPA
jgi:hypothetical protein